MKRSKNRDLRALAAGLLLTAGIGTAGSIVHAQTPEGKPSGPARGGAIVLDDARARKSLAEIKGAAAPETTRKAAALAEDSAAQQACDEARQLIGDGRFEAGLKRLESLLTDGAYFEAQQLAAEAEFGLERIAAAREAALKALELRPGAVDANYLLALIELKSKDSEAAIARLRQATLGAEAEVNNPHVTLAWLALGQTLARNGYALAAAQAYERFDRDIWDISPERRNNEQIAGYLAQHPQGALTARLDLLTRLGRNEERIKALAAARERWPEEIEIRRLAVQALLDAGKADEAFAICKPLLREVNLGGMQVATVARVAKAAGQTQAVIEASAADGDRLRGFATAWNDLGDGAAGGAAAEAALRQHPDDAAAALEAGRALFVAKAGEKAIGRLAEFVRGYPQKALWTAGDLKPWVAADGARLRADVTRRAAANERDFADNYVLGVASAALDERSQAETLLRAAADARADFSAAPAALAALFNARYEWQKVCDYLKPVIAAHPEWAAVQFEYGVALDGLDDNEAAEKAFKAAIRSGGNQTRHLIALAQHDLRLGDYVGAVRFFQQAVDAEATNAEAVEGLFDSSIRGGKEELARGLYDKIKDANLPDDVLRRIRTSMRFLRTAFSSEHLAELQAQFEQHPDDVRTGLFLAGGLFAWDRLDEARARIDELLRVDPDNAHAQALLANIHLKNADFDAAVTLLDQALQRYPNRDAFVQLHAQATLYGFRTAEARKDIERLAGMYPEKEFEFQGALLHTYTQLGDYNGALGLLEKWLKDGKREDALISEKLELMGNAGRVDEALQLAQARLDAQPEEARRREDFVAAAVKAKAFDRAEEKLRAWLRQEPGNARHFDKLITVLIGAGKGDAAVELVNTLELPGINDGSRRYMRAIVETKLDRTEAAVKDFDELLKTPNMQPENIWDIREQIVLTLGRAGQYEAALERCEGWLKEGDGNTAKLRVALGLKYAALSAAERMGEAAVIAEKLLEFDKRNPGMNNDLGYTWADQGKNLDRALPMVRIAVAKEPLNPMYLDSLGWVHYKMGAFDQALVQLERAVMLEKGRDGVIYDHLADTQWRLGRKDAAISTWKLSAEKLRESIAKRSNPRDESILKSVSAKLATQGTATIPAVAPTAAEQAGKN